MTRSCLMFFLKTNRSGAARIVSINSTIQDYSSLLTTNSRLLSCFLPNLSRARKTDGHHRQILSSPLGVHVINDNKPNITCIVPPPHIMITTKQRQLQLIRPIHIYTYFSYYQAYSRHVCRYQMSIVMLGIKINLYWTYFYNDCGLMTYKFMPLGTAS